MYKKPKFRGHGRNSQESDLSRIRKNLREGNYTALNEERIPSFRSVGWEKLDQNFAPIQNPENEQALNNPEGSFGGKEREG